MITSTHKVSIGLAITFILTISGVIFAAGQLFNKVTNLEELKPKVEAVQVDVNQIKLDVAVIKSIVGTKSIVRKGD